MKEIITPFELHVFVCTKSGENSCGSIGGEVLRDKLKTEIKNRKLNHKIRINKSGCLGKCAEGANVVIYPQGKWFHYCESKDFDKILKEIEAL